MSAAATHSRGRDATSLKPLGAYSLGILWSARVRRILALRGWRVVDARFTSDLAGVCGWALRPSADRARARAAALGAPYVALEDGFLRSFDLGLRREPPLSLLIDPVGVHYAAAAPSALEAMLASGAAETPALLAKAERGIALLRRARVSKYNIAPDTAADLPEPGYSLVIDQTYGDASIRHGGAGAESFREMLTAALDEAKGGRVVVKTHPDVVAGLKRGHFTPEDLRHVEVSAIDVSPWALIEGAARVYAVTSQMGFEAVLAGKPVTLFGAPFYAGWGVTEDRGPTALFAGRRGRALAPAALFAAAYLQYPAYYDPFFDQLTAFETTAEHLALTRRIARDNAARAHLVGVTYWKRGAARAFLGALGPKPAFHPTAAAAARAAARDGGRVVAWSSRVSEGASAAAAEAGAPFHRMEDGFLRSVGLGQDLRLPASLAIDGLGVYYDPRRPSGLERAIAARAGAPEGEGGDRRRAARLRARLIEGAVQKYMQPDLAAIAPPEAGARRKVLVLGQVEDDASIRTGTTDIATNAALLAAARAAAPDAYLVYKPHPDVEAGYRRGALGDAAALADEVAARAPGPTLLGWADEVWTMTSLMGFEALIRGKTVVCCGWPFYAGWGLTDDRGAPPPALDGAEPLAARRAARPALDDLVGAAYLDYPRYWDPVTGQICAAEVVLERLIARDPRMGRHPDPLVRLVAALRAVWFSYRGR